MSMKFYAALHTQSVVRVKCPRLTLVNAMLLLEGNMKSS